MTLTKRWEEMLEMLLACGSLSGKESVASASCIRIPRSAEGSHTVLQVITALTHV